MSTAYSLDEVARTSDDAAIRARFDAASLTLLRVLSILFLVIGLPHLVGARTPFRGALGAASVVLTVIVILAVRRRATNRIARFVQQRARGSAMVYLIAQATFLLVYNANAGNDATIAIAMMTPLVAVFLRLLPAEHVLLHALLAGMTALILTVMTVGKRPVAERIIPTVMINAMTLGAALFISRRRRRSTVAEWTERRTSAREQIRMRDELRYARELQLAMLPERAPPLDWVDICSTSIPAAEVGGDYYDYFVEREQVALVCGDVAGHGMASGLVLSALRGGFTLLRDSLHDPAAVLLRLHDLVVHTTRRRTLVTVSVVLLDRATSRVIIASAGHPPVIVRRADGSVETINLYAPPLGVRLPVNIPQRQFDYATGDVFVLHSDGIYETRSATDEVYGLERLERVIAEQGGGTAEVLRNAVLNDVTAFRGALEQDDDITIVVCRVTQ